MRSCAIIHPLHLELETAHRNIAGEPTRAKNFYSIVKNQNLDVVRNCVIPMDHGVY